MTTTASRTAPRVPFPLANGERFPAAFNERALFWVLALFACAIRFAASFAFDLNLMESYGTVMARYPSLSYVDHPPLTWWLIGLVTHVSGSENATVVRAPFILLFVASSWLLYRVTSKLFGERAALYAAIAFTFSPLFGMWAGELALTDGLTVFFVLAAMNCLAAIFFADDGAANRSMWLPWLGAGFFLGCAMASKYTTILLVPGLLIFILSGGPARRRWLLRPEPYAAVFAAATPLLPVFIWNANHGWVSFLFQGGRAGGGTGLHPGHALRWIGMQVLYLQPIIFATAVAAAYGALRMGPKRERTWFCVCIALPPLLFFAGVQLWSSHGLRGFHWGIIGWIMLFPLVGLTLANLAEKRPVWAKAWAGSVAGIFAAALLILTSHAFTGWVANAVGRINPAVFDRKDPILVELFDWTDLPKALTGRGIDPARTFVTGNRWETCSKAQYILRDRYKVLCLSRENIHFAYIADRTAFRGQDAIVVDLSADLKSVQASLGQYFERIEELEPVQLTSHGRVLMPLKLYRGIRFRVGAPGWNILPDQPFTAPN